MLLAVAIASAQSLPPTRLEAWEVAAFDEKLHRAREGYHGGVMTIAAGAAFGVHEDEVLLEEDGTVQARGQHEMALAQGAGAAEFVEYVV